MSNLMAGRPSQKKAEQELSLADVSDIEPKKIKANFNIDEDLYIKLKQHALDSRKTVTQILIELIESTVNKR